MKDNRQILFEHKKQTSGNAMKKETGKQVRWGTVSVLEFDVGYNASAVPGSGGPPVGLIGRPTCRSYLMRPVEDDVAVTDSEHEDEETELDSPHTAMKDKPLSLGYSRRNRKEMWLDPIERARILATNQAFAMDDIALICRDVQATLDSRAISQWDAVTEVLKVSRDSRQDTKLLRCDNIYSTTPEKVLLY